ncbi:hypothetical protein HG536_0C03500 [Torulaspora globosa]|uniref:Pre-mRNA-splicing factor SLT11 n=1 Tax=Torulaspora globosa TaxID=48254 RepID=A0A7G3ZF96_9SACH|nr:uncharacterized protein HG536_0C03500 [Torulaspora globosa]QLL32182.1 hypothetical protein HG536_0C03500 [Torulaspora globosa]
MGEEEPPVICDLCLGESSNVRLTKISNGAHCKICTLPYTLYHFKPHRRDSNLTKTLICTRCSKQRNICQCCMLDMVWHIPLQLRDRMLAMIEKDPANITEEAKNDMMKRFLALKDVKLGGARTTSDPREIDKLMNKLQEILHQRPTNAAPQATITDPSAQLENFRHVDIARLLRRLPLNQSFGDTAACKSFFVYNIDPSIPEWKISSAIAETVGTDEWQDRTTTSLVINHKAHCGGFRFKNEDLGLKFIRNLQASSSTLLTTQNLRRGVLNINHFRIFVIPWTSGFSAASFGASTSENIKLSLSLNKMISMETAIPRDHVLKAVQATAKSKDNKVTKRRAKSKRISNIEL